MTEDERKALKESIFRIGLFLGRGEAHMDIPTAFLEDVRKINVFAWEALTRRK